MKTHWWVWDWGTKAQPSFVVFSKCSYKGLAHRPELPGVFAGWPGHQAAEFEIYELPECQSDALVKRECIVKVWDEKRQFNAFTLVDIDILMNEKTWRCELEYEYTVCAYPIIEVGILGEGDLGINKKPEEVEEAIQPRRQRDRGKMRKRDSRRPSARGRR